MSRHELPPPSEFGLSYPEWRPGQVDALFKATDAPTRFSGLVLPTGFGKSLVYMAAAVLSGQRTVILTSTKALQRQLMRDFGALDGVALVQGQRAYVCEAMQPGGELFAHFGSERYTTGDYTVMADHGPCHLGVQCSLKSGGCGYFDAVRAAVRAQVLITNYAWWFAILHQTNLRPLINPDLLVLDEAHEAPDALADAIGATLYARDVADVLHEELPGAGAREPEEWSGWARQWALRLAARLEHTNPTNRGAVQIVRRAQFVLRSLQRIAGIDPKLLLTSDEHEAVRFDVVWAAEYAEQWLFRRVPRIVMTSATFNRQTAAMLGIAPDDLTFYEAGTGFPVERRPIYLVSNIIPVRVDHRMSAVAEQAWLNMIDNIIRARQDRKGIIHCVSYARRDRIIARSEFREQMMTHGRHDAADRISRFKTAPPGTVLVSPSVTTGYDFPYDQCEYQIIAKVPFPDSRDPVTAQRTLIDAKYPAHLAMRELVQGVGRGMRAEDDQCETFIIDDHARWFLSKHADLAPRWFKRAIERVETVPVPPPPLARHFSAGETDGEE